MATAVDRNSYHSAFLLCSLWIRYSSNNAKNKGLQLLLHRYLPHPRSLRPAAHHSSFVSVPSFRPAQLPSFRSYRSFLIHLNSQKFSFPTQQLFPNSTSSVFLPEHWSKRFCFPPNFIGQKKTLLTWGISEACYQFFMFYWVKSTLQ